ncbi:MAG: sel1 repeat family protein [Robiginitomaculum sp.]|nr:sel1 repeat family protein [Robiginitomaculum sp.]
MCALFATTSSVGALASETNSPEYGTALAAYETGDYANALVYGKLAGAGGNAEAQVLVGHILMKGLGGFTDKKDAAGWFKRAAQSGNTDAMLALGELALAEQGGLSAPDALHWLTRAADENRTDAMIALAEMYRVGHGAEMGVDMDVKKARQWLVKATNNGDSFAAYELGNTYLDKDPKLALHWYEKSAELGEAQGAYGAAILYAENYNIKPDAHKAAKLLKQAAQAGLPAAQADYGLVVYQGNGTERSIDEAAKWFKKAAENGDPEGRFLYAFTLAKGEGVAQSFEDAYYWLLRAEESGTSGINEYDQSRNELKTRLENNVDPAILSRARARVVTGK